MKVELNKVFEVSRNGKTYKWKVIEHPYFSGSLTLVRGYNGMTGQVRKEDFKHIGGPVTLETAYEIAYIHS